MGGAQGPNPEEGYPRADDPEARRQVAEMVLGCRDKELEAADAALISDSDFFVAGLPSITYGLRGIAYFEIGVEGPSADIHSGQHGGAAQWPHRGP